MKEYMLKLKNKYGYSDELLEFLNRLILCLIDYYGAEYKDTILEALLNCEIHIQRENENPKTFLNQYFGVNEEWEIPLLAGGFYHVEYNLQDNNLVSKSIIYITTGGPDIYLPFRFDSDSCVNNLIHEILHLIKGYGKLKMRDNYIIDSTGLLKKFYSYSLEEGFTLENCENLGIEEALNCVETSQILEMMTGEKKEIRGYKEAAEIAKVLLENSGFAQAVRKSQFSGDDSWIQFLCENLGEDQSKLLIENLDKLVIYHFATFKILNTPEKRKKFSEDKRNTMVALNELLNKFFSKKL